MDRGWKPKEGLDSGRMEEYLQAKKLWRLRYKKTKCYEFDHAREDWLVSYQ